MDDMPSSTAGLDVEALRDRYRAERDRRVATDASERQYRDVEQGFARLLDDPYGTAPARAAVHDDVDVLVVGAGFGGMMVAARLREAGIAKVRICDTASDVGGTW